MARSARAPLADKLLVGSLGLFSSRDLLSSEGLDIVGIGRRRCAVLPDPQPVQLSTVLARSAGEQVGTEGWSRRPNKGTLF
jgi:hypothetical protein